jgi:hypothetical protein
MNVSLSEEGDRQKLLLLVPELLQEVIHWHSIDVLSQKI